MQLLKTGRICMENCIAFVKGLHPLLTSLLGYCDQGSQKKGKICKFLLKYSKSCERSMYEKTNVKYTGYLPVILQHSENTRASHGLNLLII